MRTRVTELLGIKYPILQGGMAWVAEPELAAAVSNAGGFGIISGSMDTPEVLIKKIHKMKILSGKPFGVNFTPACECLETNLNVCIKEKVTAVIYGRGRHTTDMITKKLCPHDIICIPVTATVKQAIRIEKEGAHAVIVSGLEAGGHVSRIATMALLPQATEKVRIPIIAAGGFGDGRGLAAALTLGADAIQMGTRFICVKESPVPEPLKLHLLRATEADTLVTGHITGLRCRVLKNQLTEAFVDLEDRKAPQTEYNKLGQGKLRAAFVDGDIQWGSIAAGQIVGMLEDIPSCQELLDQIVGLAKEAVEEARLKLSVSPENLE